MDIFSDNLIGAPPNTPLVHKGYGYNGGGWSPSQLGWDARESGQPNGSYNAVTWGVNRLDLFKRSNTDNKIYWKYWNGGSNWKPSQAGWTYMNGQGKDTPYAVSWSANRLDVFIRGMDGAIWANGSPDGGASWYGWYSLAGGPSERTPTAVAWGPNRLDVFENVETGGYSGNIYHKWWNGSTWGPAQTGAGEWLGPVSFGNPPKVVSWGVDHIDLFGRSSSGVVYHKAWNIGWTPAAGSAWENLGAP